METEEKTQEATPEVVADDSAQTEPEKSQREIELEQALEKAQKEAKAHQSTASKKAQEAQRWQNEVGGLKSQLEASNTKIDVLAEMFEESLRTEDYSEPKQRTSFQERVKSKIKPLPDPKLVEEQTRMKSVASEIYELTDKTGKPFDKTKDFREAYLLFKSGDYELALEEVKEITEKMTEAKEVKETKESEEARIDRLVNEKLKQIAKEKGELQSVTGQSGNSINEEEIRKNFRENPSDPQALQDYIKLTQGRGY